MRKPSYRGKRPTTTFSLSLRYYGEESAWGVRHLGGCRWALDLGRVALIWEVLHYA